MKGQVPMAFTDDTARTKHVLVEIEHDTGRKLWCNDYSATHVRCGVLCGAVDDVYQDRLQEARERTPTCEDLSYYFIEPPDAEYRPVFVVATFLSDPIDENAGDSSWLEVGWFQEHTSPVPDEENRTALARLPWDEHATDAYR